MTYGLSETKYMDYKIIRKGVHFIEVSVKRASTVLGQLKLATSLPQRVIYDIG